MLRWTCASSLLFACAFAAHGATLSVSSNKLVYYPGETVTLTVSGDDEGATDYAVFGRLLYDGALVNNATRSQIALVGPNGSWAKGALTFGDDGTDAYSDAFSQFTLTAQTADNLPGSNPFATVTLTAVAPGIVDVSWWTGEFNELLFFGLTNAPGTSFCIDNLADTGCIGFIPEPSTGALLGFGLLALALVWRST